MIVLFGLLGLAFLFAGAELLISGGTSLASRLNLSPLVIGLTLVAFGTSSPELIVSVQGAIGGYGDLSLANVIGSNIFNVLIILGISSQIVPLVVSQKLIQRDVPLLIGLSLLLFLLGLDGLLMAWEGILLLVALIVYTTWAILQSRRETEQFRTEYEEMLDQPLGFKSFESTWIQILMVISGLAALLLGARWFTTAAVSLARLAGLSEWVIGITIVSAGTSLPEVGASVMASIRGEQDIAVGNVVGSNLFNLMGVLGLSTVLSSSSLVVRTMVLQFDLPFMIAVTVACLPVFFSGHRISRLEGVVFLAYYFIYLAILLLSPITGQPGYMTAFVVVLPLLLGTVFFVRMHPQGTTDGP
ncbi:MAG: calcium/sodium antiporter [bacterium]